jgi:hypothetical protein
MKILKTRFNHGGSCEQLEERTYARISGGCSGGVINPAKMFEEILIGD